ncbi:MAG: response regulator [Candidatus Saccharibacteria bacterium]|jgi:DNA-binding response OmpR family regulator
MDEAKTQIKKKILLVEDDNALADIYFKRLDSEGFEVKRVNNGESALAAAVEFHPDLIVLDIMMPEINGFEVLDILKNTPATAQIKVMMLTALGQESDQEKAKTLGADAYLVKSQIITGEVVSRIKSMA